MENYDERRRRDQERQQGRYSDQGRERDSWWRGANDPRMTTVHGVRNAVGATTTATTAGPASGRAVAKVSAMGKAVAPNARGSRPTGRRGCEPRYSEDPYYSRNREQDTDDYSSRSRFGARQSDDQREWDQRSRDSLPREQRELAERSRRGSYYDPSWPYERSGRGRDEQRSREEEQESHYRGYYSRSATPFSYPGGSGYLYSESMTLHGPYTGRGPKGYKRSDQQIIEEACQRLERDGEIDASEIEVSAEDGVIRLRGTVHDRKAKRRAEECVESIYGARDVMNELRVEQQGRRRAVAGPAGRPRVAVRVRLAERPHRRLQTSGQGAQGSQASTGSGSQATPGSQSSTQGNRPGAGSSGSEQGSDDKRTPRR